MCVLERYGLPQKKWCWLFEAPTFRHNQYVVAYRRKNGMGQRKNILYMSVTEMGVYYVKAIPYTCFSNISVYYAVDIEFYSFDIYWKMSLL